MMNPQSNQPYFSGEVHDTFRTEEDTIQFARGLIDRFKAAIPGLDNLIIGWWDGSTGENEAGIGMIVDACLPGVPKFSIVKARPVNAHGGDSVLTELNGCLETCFTIRKMLGKCEARGVLRDIVSPLEIILVTDCLPIIVDARGQEVMGGSAAPRRTPVLRQIKDLSDKILNFGGFVKLDMYHCRRNQVERRERCDRLAARARTTQKSHRSTIEYEGSVIRARGVKNNFEYHVEPTRITTLEAERGSAASRFPMKSTIAGARRSERLSRKRKQPVAEGEAIVVEEEADEDEDDEDYVDEYRVPQHRHKRRRVNSSSEEEAAGEVVEDGKVVICLD